MTLNDLERQFSSVLCLQCYACCDQIAEARITQISLALYLSRLSFLYIKFDDEIERESIRISSIIFDYSTSKVKLTSRLGYLQLDVTVTGSCNTNA